MDQFLGKRNLRRGVLLMLAVPWLCSMPARADLLQISLQSPVSVNSGSSGGLDVYLTDLSTGTSGVIIGGFSYEFQSSSPDVIFTSATTASVIPYLFSGNSFADTQLGGALAVQTSPDLIALDFAATANSGASLANGQTLALGRLFFAVSPTAPSETVFLTFVNGLNTVLTDPSGNPLSISDLSGGTINISAVSAPVPDGSSWTLLLLAVLLIWPKLYKVRESKSRRSAY